MYAPALNKNTQEQLVNNISNFVEGIHLEESAKRSGCDNASIGDNVQPGTSRGDASVKPNEMAADKFIIQAEQFKANVAAPQGTLSHPVYDNDDDFFHMTCHVDPTLKVKTERGESVELDKLLPKDRNAVSYMSEDKKMELVSKNGLTYFAPVQDRNSKITGIRKWVQDFRVYAAIYSQANQSHASEIWQ